MFILDFNREKYDASKINNPIRDVLKDQGLDSLPWKTAYGDYLQLDGDTILDTLCPNTIETIQGKNDLKISNPGLFANYYIKNGPTKYLRFYLLI